MKFFVPAVGYRIKLTRDWEFTLYYESRNDSLTKLVDPTFTSVNCNWSDRFKDEGYCKYRTIQVMFPAETLLEVDRVYVRTMNKSASKENDYDSVTFKTTRGGKKVRFWAKLSDVNNIEYELPSDYAEAKTMAVENAKKPKKMSLDKIREAICHHAYDISYKRHARGRAKWLTPSAIAQLKKCADEYNRLCVPYHKREHERYQKERIAELKQSFIAGTLSIPVSLVDLVKTPDDIMTYMGDYYCNYTTPFDAVRSKREWDYVLAYVLISRFSYSRMTYVLTKEPDGTRS